MNLTTITDRIHDLNIVDLIKHYGVDLKKAGTVYKACCPLPGHDEKTASFTVNPAKGIYKCFGCGKGGDAISFVMEKESLPFWESVKDIAAKYSLALPEYESKEDQDKAEREYQHKESLYLANSKVLDIYLDTPVPYNEMNYIINRVHPDQEEKFMVGYTPDQWQHVHETAKKAGLNEKLLLELGILQESKGKIFDSRLYAGRMIFPIHNERGKIAGFSARVIGDHDKKIAKYQNSPESKIFKKSKILYGLWQAKEAIRNEGFAYRVEGQTDVIALHQYGIENVVAPLGTALTADHVKLLNRFTANVVILTDGDKAGRKAAIKDGELFIDHGFNVSVLMLPDGEDPDSFLKSGNNFIQYTEENSQDYIVWLAVDMLENAQSTAQKADAMTNICKLMMAVDDQTKIDLFIDDIIKTNKSYGPRKKWNDKIKQLRSDKKQDNKPSLPKTASLSDFEKYGFYEDGHCYFFQNRYGHNEQGSNFSLRPLFHLESTNNAKRLFEMTNEFGYSIPMEFAQKDLISISQFRLKLESLGNFLWMASEAELIKLKKYLYEKTDTAKEVTQLGWQKDGFWAWANGIFTGEHFVEINKYGIVTNKEKNYYLPAFATTFEKDDDLFVEERKYKFEITNDNPISLYDYTQRFVSVFGSNAMIGMCYLIASLFRDIVVRTTGFFPILNIFGPKNTGKSAMAKSLLRFFGKHKGGPNITNTSKPALAQYVGHVSNGLVHLEEYKNNMNDIDKYEFLKGLWDGTGRTVMNMERDRKKETSAVDTGVVLTGQEMPTIDIALYTRLVYLTFSLGVHTEQEKAAFNQLKRIEEQGINHLVHDIIKHRAWFEEQWTETYKQTAKEMLLVFDESEDQIQDRIFNNWIVCLASYRVLEDKLKLHFSYADVAKVAAEMIREQNKETEKGDEVSGFWDSILALVSDGTIMEGVDYKIDYLSELKIDDKVSFEWEGSTPVLMLNHSRVFKLYRKQGRQSGDTTLPIKSLEFYLKSHNSFLGKKKSVAFKKIDPASGRVAEATQRGDKMIHPRQITTAYCFRYDLIGVDLETSFEEEDVFESETPVRNLNVSPEKVGVF